LSLELIIFFYSDAGDDYGEGGSEVDTGMDAGGLGPRRR
jgi:hypothetical protein